MVLAVDDLAAQLHALGVQPGGVLLVHTSFRAVRPVEGGPEGLIAALRAVLGPEGSLAMPSWTGDDAAVFDPAQTPAAADLGITAEIFRRQPDVRRSAHPFAFAAAGPEAARIVDTPLPLPPHGPDSPVGRIHDLDGQILLLGCGHDANTSLHLAEILGGAPYRVTKSITVMREGRPERIEYGENDHCCERFALADGWLREAGLQREGPVGRAHARLFAARDVVRLACDRLAEDRLIFLHPQEAACPDCDAARSSIR